MILFLYLNIYSGETLHEIENLGLQSLSSSTDSAFITLGHEAIRKVIEKRIFSVSCYTPFYILLSQFYESNTYLWKHTLLKELDLIVYTLEKIYMK